MLNPERDDERGNCVSANSSDAPWPALCLGAFSMRTRSVLQMLQWSHSYDEALQASVLKVYRDHLVTAVDTALDHQPFTEHRVPDALPGTELKLEGGLLRRRRPCCRA